MSDVQRETLKQGWARRRALGLPGPRLGIKHTTETKRKISAITRERTPKGSAHPHWKGGVTSEQRRDRKSPGYKTWRREVRENAGDICECCECNHGHGRMHAHHIKAFAIFPELRLTPLNGAWLCDDCHEQMKYPTD